MAKRMNRAARMTRNNARIAGTQKYCMGQASILVLGTSMTPTQVIEVYQSDLACLAAVDAARLAYVEAVTKANASALTTNSFDKGFKSAIEGAYGNSSTTMGTFGIVQTTPSAPTVATKAAAITKAEATRVLRHTMSAKQKLALKAPSADATAVAQPRPTTAPTPPVGNAGTTPAPTGGGGTATGSARSKIDGGPCSPCESRGAVVPICRSPGNS